MLGISNVMRKYEMPYQAFFLSEHTASLNTEAIKSDRRIIGKQQMVEQSIFEVINHAILKNE